MNHLEFLRTHYLDQPYEVAIETLALCNAACTFCPYPTLERKGTRMEQSVMDRLLREMSEWPRPFYISPFKVNEPFLDFRLLPFCRAINDHIPHATLRLFTNGSPLSAHKLREVDDLERVAHLWISLNSHEPEEYQRLMSLDFNRTTARLDELHGMIERGYFRHPVVVSKVSHHADQELGFQMYCANRWPLFQTFLIKQDGWLGYVPPADPAIPDTSCQRWFELSILATGVASLCCMDGTGQFQRGNIHDRTLLDVYNDPWWKGHRQSLISRREVYPCSTCTY